MASVDYTLTFQEFWGNFPNDIFFVDFSQRVGGVEVIDAIFLSARWYQLAVDYSVWLPEIVQNWAA